jgi:hypothetical protein
MSEVREDSYQGSTLSLRAHEIDEDDVQECWENEHEEKLPGDIIERDWSGDKQYDVCEVETHHADSCTLTSDMRWENFGAAIISNRTSKSWPCTYT